MVVLLVLQGCNGVDGEKRYYHVADGKLVYLERGVFLENIVLAERVRRGRSQWPLT